MSHLHIPDGVLPIWIVAAGWGAAAVILAVATHSLQQRKAESRLALLGMMSALMLVAMSLELIPISYHFDLTVISGIVLQPALGFIAAFVVNLILALFGHGGITVVGLNTLVIGTEISLGYYLFRGMHALLPRRLGAGVEAAAVAAVVLAIGSLLMIGIVALSNVNPGVAVSEATAAPSGTLSFRNPFGQGVLVWEPFPIQQQPEEQPKINLVTFAGLVLGLGAIGWTIEAVIIGTIAHYLALVRPDLLGVAARPVRQ